MATTRSLLAFSPSCDVLAEAAPDGRLQLWDTATSALRQQLVRNSHLAVRTTSVSWHEPARKAGGPSAALIAVGCDNGSVFVWDVARGELAHELKGHTGPVLDVAFAGGDGTLYSSGADRQVCSWSATSGVLLNTTKAGKVAVHRLALSPDGAHMLLGGSAMRLVRLQGWKRVSRLAGHAEPVQCVSFSPDGKYLLSSSGDRHVTLWAVSYSSSAASDAIDQSVGAVALEASVVCVGASFIHLDVFFLSIISIDRSIYIFLGPYYQSRSIYLSTCRPIDRSLSIYLDLLIYISIYLVIYLSIHISISIHMHNPRPRLTPWVNPQPVGIRSRSRSRVRARAKGECA